MRGRRMLFQYRPDCSAARLLQPGDCAKFRAPAGHGHERDKRMAVPRHRRVRMIALAILAAALQPVFAGPASADEVEDFYQNHTLKMVISYSVGGGYDLYARVLARYLGKYIPGHPTVVPENMPGAGGLRASNYLYNAAPKDGSVIATFSRSIPTMPLVTSGLTFDGRKFGWIGSMSGDTSLCLTGARSPVKTFADMLTMPVVMGGQYAAADSDIYARLYRNIFGARIKLVSGYPGTNDITLAMERGEVDGICGLSWGTIKVAHPDYLKDKSVNFLVQAALKKDPELSGVPLALDLVDDPEKKQILYLHFAPQAIGRPFAAPPGIPENRKAALVQAFDKALRDPDLLAEAEREKMDIAPMTGHEIDALLGELYALPPGTIAKAAKAIAE
jgi:tripartite-type tricarboxylate transporter receptor subunit TctC